MVMAVDGRDCHVGAESYVPYVHTSIMSHSPRHFIARVSLAKRPRPMLQDSLHFFRSDLIFSLLPGLSLPKKGAVTLRRPPPPSAALRRPPPPSAALRRLHRREPPPLSPRLQSACFRRRRPHRCRRRHTATVALHRRRYRCQSPLPPQRELFAQQRRQRKRRRQRSAAVAVAAQRAMAAVAAVAEAGSRAVAAAQLRQRRCGSADAAAQRRQ